MLAPALACPDPVLMFEHIGLYNMEGDAALHGPVDLDHAVMRRPGRDVCLLTYGASLFRCLEAADQLAQEGIEAEVVDLRTLRPLDDATIMNRCAAAGAPSWSTRAGAAAALLRKSPRASWSRRFTIWMRR